MTRYFAIRKGQTGKKDEAIDGKIIDADEASQKIEGE